MSDLITTSLRLQRQLLDAHKATLTASRKYAGPGDEFVRLQEAEQRVVQANMAVATAWLRMWER